MQKRARFVRPTLELLEDRTVPYALSGYKWGAPNISASYLPDGTPTAGSPSNLFATLDARGKLALSECRVAEAVAERELRLEAFFGVPAVADRSAFVIADLEARAVG